LALSKVVDYARFRMQPRAGFLPTRTGCGTDRLWVEQLVEGLTDASPLMLSPAQVRELMAGFAFPSPTGCGGTDPWGLDDCHEPLADPDFGPIWRFHRQGEASILRITPLTDIDIADVVERLQLPRSADWPKPWAD